MIGNNLNLKNYFAWMVIYLVIGAVASLLLPFKYAMGVMLIVIFLGNIIRAEIRLRKAGVGGIKGRYKSLSSSGFGQNSSNSGNLYKYYCLNCGKEHSQIACPNCGSKAVKDGLWIMNNSKWDFACSVSELESLGLQTRKLNELNDSYEIENLVENLKQKHYEDYKSMPVFTD